MASIKINDIDMPEPVLFEVKLKNINSSNSGLSASGELFVERVKSNIVTINLAWKTSGTSTPILINSMSPALFNVTFLHPLTNTFVTDEFTATEYDNTILHFDGVNTTWLTTVTFSQEV